MDGFSNLSAMEIDPNGSIQDLLQEHGEGGTAGATAGDGGFGAGGIGGMMQDLAFSVCRPPFSFLFFPLTFHALKPIYTKYNFRSEKGREKKKFASVAKKEKREGVEKKGAEKCLANNRGYYLKTYTDPRRG